MLSVPAATRGTARKALWISHVAKICRYGRKAPLVRWSRPGILPQPTLTISNFRFHFISSPSLISVFHFLLVFTLIEVLRPTLLITPHLFTKVFAMAEHNQQPMVQPDYQQPPPPANMAYQSNGSNQALSEKPHNHGVSGQWSFGFWDCFSPLDTWYAFPVSIRGPHANRNC